MPPVLNFKANVRFEIDRILTYQGNPRLIHLVGYFLTGKFTVERLIRARPDSRWEQAKVIEIQTRQLRESIGFENPVQYILPMDSDFLLYDEVAVLEEKSVSGSVEDDGLEARKALWGNDYVPKRIPRKVLNPRDIIGTVESLTWDGYSYILYFYKQDSFYYFFADVYFRQKLGKLSPLRRSKILETMPTTFRLVKVGRRYQPTEEELSNWLQRVKEL